MGEMVLFGAPEIFLPAVKELNDLYNKLAQLSIESRVTESDSFLHSQF